MVNSLVAGVRSAGNACLQFVRMTGQRGFFPYVYVDPRSEERKLLLICAGTSDYLGGVFAPECSVLDVVEAFRVLKGDSAWDVAHPGQIRCGSKLGAALRTLNATESAGGICSTRAAVPISMLPKNVRADVLYHRNAASGRGNSTSSWTGVESTSTWWCGCTHRGGGRRIRRVF